MHEVKVDFDADLPRFHIEKGVHRNKVNGEVLAPVAMWLAAIDLVFSKLQAIQFDFRSVKAISGAGQQHGSM